MSESYITVNIEEGMPLKDQAIKRLTFYVNSKKNAGYAALKVIHGFGSSGSGGVIRVAARDYLASLQRRGVIKSFIRGEDFSIFDAQTRGAFDLCPELRQDRDLERHNNGVTIVLLR